MSLILLAQITAAAALLAAGIMLLFTGPRADFLYQILFREAQDPIFLMTAKKTLNLNKAALKLFGISKKDVRHFVPYEFSPPFQPDGSPSREKAFEYVKKALNGEPQDFTWVHQNKEGKPFDAQVSLNRFRFLGRSYLLSIVRDITREKEAYDSIVREEERFKTLFEHFPVGISEQDFSETKRKLEEIKTREGKAFTTLEEYFSRHPDEAGECIDGMRFLAVNTTVLKIFGARTLEELAANRHAIIDPEAEKLYIREMEAILSGVSRFEGEAFYRDLSGNKVFIRKRWVAAPGQEETLKRVFVSAVDMTAFYEAREAERASEQKYQMLVEKGNDGIVILQEGKITFSNSKTGELLGYSQDELEYRDFLTLLTPEERPKVAEFYKKRLQGEEVPSIYETMALTKDGRELPMEFNVSLIDDDGKPAVLAFVRDISFRVDAERSMRVEKALFEGLFDNAPESIVLVTPDSIITRVNRAFLSMFGWEREEVMGKNIDELLTSQETRSEAYSITHEIKDGAELYTEIETMRLKKDGTPLDVSIIGVPVALNNEKLAVYGIYRDISQRKADERALKEATKKLEELARTDPLTGLLNRRGLLEMMEYEIKRAKRSGKRFSVIMGDIDHFKEINDLFGHDTGDIILENLADIMKKTLRSQDIISRWGGEEFLILLPETPLTGAQCAAEKLRQRIMDHVHHIRDMEFNVTITFGVCEVKSDFDTEICIKRADNALYQGKESGRNRVMASGD